MVLTAPPASAEAEDCPAFERAVSISVGKANGTFAYLYRYHQSAGTSVAASRNLATTEDNKAFWRSLIVQTSAIVDYSVDPELFTPMYFIANATKMDSLGKSFGEAMGLCNARFSGSYPNERLVP
jgi:hypothetical protein